VAPTRSGGRSGGDPFGSPDSNSIRDRIARWRKQPLEGHLRRLWSALTVIPTVVFFFLEANIHPAYRIGWPQRLRLGFRMWRNTRRVFTGTSYKAHLAMAVKLFEIPPEVEGAVVECGCYLGGSTANLSLACDLVGRQLIVYDSFEGLPAPTPGDQYAKAEATGLLAADLAMVQDNVRSLGAIDRCSFRKGWFSDTLPHHTEPVVLMFLDVDYQQSLDDCIRYLWPKLTDQGYVFIDEYVLPDYCALFWSERYWRTRFNRHPPGLIGSGSGIGTGGYYLGPFDWGNDPTSIAYTRKDMSGFWNYYPDAEVGEETDVASHAGG
jgi:O-methyltransferase